MLSWSTLDEQGAVGFFVDRVVVGRHDWVRINDVLLPGMVDAPLGGEYLYADPDARTGVDYDYTLIEQEAWGGQREYGPFRLRYE